MKYDVHRRSVEQLRRDLGRCPIDSRQWSSSRDSRWRYWYDEMGYIYLAITASSRASRVLFDLLWFECTGSSQEYKQMYFASKLSCLHHSLGLSSVALVQNLHTIKIRSSFITSTRGVASHPSKSFDDVRGSTKTASSPTPSSLLHNPPNRWARCAGQSWPVPGRGPGACILKENQ